MAEFLIRSCFKNHAFWEDDEIWNYALINNLIIITKDKDFRLKQLISGSPPKIIHIKFANLVLKDFEKVINSNWNQIEQLIIDHSIVNVFTTLLKQ
jgi:predicted nuclease of predicted toxin-antitoxin system